MLQRNCVLCVGVCQRGLGRRGSKDWIRWPVSGCVSNGQMLLFWDSTSSSSRWRSTAQTTRSAFEPHSHLRTGLVLLNTWVRTKKHNYVSIQHSRTDTWHKERWKTAPQYLNKNIFHSLQTTVIGLSRPALSKGTSTTWHRWTLDAELLKKNIYWENLIWTELHSETWII